MEPTCSTTQDGEARPWQQREELVGVEQPVEEVILPSRWRNGGVVDHHEHGAVPQPPQLSESFFEKLDQGSNFGQQFSNRIAVICP